MRIIFDASDTGISPTSGVGRLCYEVLMRLSEAHRDFKFLLIVPRTGRQRLPAHPSITIVREISFPERKLFAPLNGLARLLTRLRIRRFRPDIYQTTHYQVPRVDSLPTVAVVHDFIDANTFSGLSGNEPSFAAQVTQALQRSEAVIAVSEATKADAVRFAGIAPEKIGVAWLGVDPFFAVDERSGASASGRPPQPYFLFVGSRFAYKNFGTVLRAWEKICRDEETRCYLVCAGGKENLDPWQIDFAIAHRLVKQLIMLGPASDEHLRELYRGATAFIFPSLAEGFGLPLVEAMATGCPVIASDIPVFREVAGESAFFFDPQSADDLAALMKRCLSAPPPASSRETARARAQSFSWDRTASVFAETYQSVFRG